MSRRAPLSTYGAIHGFDYNPEMLRIPGLLDTQYIPKSIEPEVHGAFDRAVQAGAPLPLSYVGAGMYGIVFCDEAGHAWKVARFSELATENHRAYMLEKFAEEYEWLRDAEGTSIERNVSKVYAIHPDPIVLERECVPGSPGTWADGTRLSHLHRRIGKVMEVERGWTAPEFKEDSYVIRPDGTAVLVDTSSVHRLGMNLAGWIEDVLDGRRTTKDRWHDLAFYLLQERRHKTIPKPYLDRLLRRLVEKDPEIARGFVL